MPRRHAARPRLVLVVDKSSSDNSIPSSRAKRSKRKCHLPGIPVSGQFRIVDSGRPSFSANGRKPPKRSMTCEGDTPDIPSRYPKNGHHASPYFGRTEADCPETGQCHNQAMARQKRIRKPTASKVEAKKILKSQMARNLKDIRLAKELTAREMAEALGVTESTYRNYEAPGKRKADTISLPHLQIKRLMEIQGSAIYLFLRLGPPLLDIFSLANAKSARKGSPGDD